MNKPILQPILESRTLDSLARTDSPLTSLIAIENGFNIQNKILNTISRVPNPNDTTDDLSSPVYCLKR